MQEASLNVNVTKSQSRFRKLKDREEPRAGIGEFFLLLDITAVDGDIYIPLSMASGKKPAGFVYQIEGTGVGTVSSTDISCTKATKVTLGTIVYAKIPSGKTGTFRIVVEIRGKAPEEYAIVITHINYKHTPSDARYKKYQKEIRTKVLKSR